jgi:hypothetical protein
LRHGFARRTFRASHHPFGTARGGLPRARPLFGLPHPRAGWECFTLKFLRQTFCFGFPKVFHKVFRIGFSVKNANKSTRPAKFLEKMFELFSKNT